GDSTLTTRDCAVPLCAGPLVGREAIEQPGAARADEVLLAAAAARVGGVPRGVRSAGPVVMPQLGGAHAPARPVVAGAIGAVGERAAVGLRPGEHVVHVGLAADAVHLIALFGERRRLGQGIADAGLVERVTVQVAEVLRDAAPFGVVPRTVPDSIARVDRVGALCAEVGVPGT